MTPQQFARAHDAYLRPPKEPPMNTCPECDGEKTIPYSACCESEMRNGHCMECGQNCTEATCSTCNGTGVILLEVVKEDRDYEED